MRSRQAEIETSLDELISTRRDPTLNLTLTLALTLTPTLTLTLTSIPTLPPILTPTPTLTLTLTRRELLVSQGMDLPPCAGLLEALEDVWCSP